MQGVRFVHCRRFLAEAIGHVDLPKRAGRCSDGWLHTAKILWHGNTFRPRSLHVLLNSFGYFPADMGARLRAVIGERVSAAYSLFHPKTELRSGCPARSQWSLPGRHTSQGPEASKAGRQCWVPTTWCNGHCVDFRVTRKRPSQRRKSARQSHNDQGSLPHRNIFE